MNVSPLYKRSIFQTFLIIILSLIVVSPFVVLGQAGGTPAVTPPPNATGGAGGSGAQGAGGSGSQGAGGTPALDAKNYLDNLYIWFLGFVGISALFAIVVGGILYMFSGTSITKVDQAKKWITNAFLGLVIAGGSYLLLSIINPDLVKGFDISTVVDNAIKNVNTNTSPPPGTNTPPPTCDTC